MRLGLWAILKLSLAVPATAGDFSLSNPIDCDLSGPCYIQQYVDHDPSDKASDFTCAGLSYDGHKGTDFALPTSDMIQQGINVLAAASGRIARARDGMEDIAYNPARQVTVTGRECGNGIVIVHTDGWETQYCHLRKDSITVVSGQQVRAGDILGQVGMSGRAAFPHLHLSVRHDGAVVDPFDPDGNLTCGSPDTDTLWADPPSYRAGGILSMGTSGRIPELAEIRANNVTPATVQSDALVIYALLFGTQKEDVLRLSINGPEGEVITHDAHFKEAQAQSFRAIGKKAAGMNWPAGSYDGLAILLRQGSRIDSKALTFSFP